MVLSMSRWMGKIAIVSGASSGIGAAITKKLVQEGLVVVGLARRTEHVEELAKNLSGCKGVLHAKRCDISKEDDILDAFNFVKNNLGLVHVLINNAGATTNKCLVDGDVEQWRRILDVNVLGLSIATREAVKVMRENEVAGHVVHVNSITGHKIIEMYPVHMYGASKYAVTCLAGTLKAELHALKSNIKVTSISPGVVKTDFFDGMSRPLNFDQVPHLNPEDVADGVAYTLSTPPDVQVDELTIRSVHGLV